MIKTPKQSPNGEKSRFLLPSLTVQPQIELVFLGAVICLAAFFRLYQLGESAFRADTMIFMDFAHQSINAGGFFTKWISALGMNKTGQFPFAVAWMKLFLDLTGAPLTPFMIRFTSALWGIFAVLAIYGCGRVIAGNVFALFLAVLFALNPFHIGVSREAYFYPPLVCGSALLLWAILLQIKAVRDKDSLPVTFYILLASGFFLTTYSQPSSWSFAFLAILIILWFQIRIGLQRPTPSVTDGLRRLNRRIPRSLLWIALVVAAIGIPLLFADWALPQMIASSSAEHKAHVTRVFGANLEPISSLLARTLFSFCWGTTPPRVLFTVIVILLSVVATIRFWRRTAMMPVFLVLLAGGIVIYVSVRYLLLAAVSSRYLLAFLPLYSIWVACGLWFTYYFLVNLGWINRKICFAITLGFMAVALGLNIWPAWLATQLTGKPIPYWDITRWCDKSLPPRTLVLVERWLDAWNELRVHNSTNVIFTFTVPSEPDDVFKQLNWPATAKAFFEKFPDAAYLEYYNSGRARMGVVSNWHFSRRVVFTNEAGIKLARLGLAHREEFFNPHTNCLTATIFYNTREDTIAQARDAGRQYLILYGQEWGYVKLWRQLQDFRDWRVLEKTATLDIYNLTAFTNRATLKIRGMALNGMKRVEVKEPIRSGHDFRHLQLEEWRLADIILKPGLNKIAFSDSLWSVSSIPLLVDQVEVSPPTP